MNYVYKNGCAIGYMQGEVLIRFPAPINAALLTD